MNGRWILSAGNLCSQLKHDSPTCIDSGWRKYDEFADDEESCPREGCLHGSSWRRNPTVMQVLVLTAFGVVTIYHPQHPPETSPRKTLPEKIRSCRNRRCFEMQRCLYLRTSFNLGETGRGEYEVWLNNQPQSLPKRNLFPNELKREQKSK